MRLGVIALLQMHVVGALFLVHPENTTHFQEIDLRQHASHVLLERQV